jgi:hypothetical protein
VNVSASFAICVLIYELLIRPFRPMRFLFGMTPTGTPVGLAPSLVGSGRAGSLR